jgi:DNA replication and repair protein RecF
LYLRELSLINYRNYSKLELAFNSNLIIISGRNAQGKTNILESIFLSCTGRSHRTPRDRELILQGEKESMIRTMVEKREGPSLI